MPTFDDARHTLLSILGGQRLTPDEVQSRLQRALDPGYWSSLRAPASPAGFPSAPGLEGDPLGDGALAAAVGSLARDGYFHTAPVIAGAVVDGLRGSVDAIRRADWPEVFAFVYDEFWQVLRSRSLVRLMTAHLGKGYRLIPQIWIFYVHATAGAKGWPPHADSRARPRRLTVWIPLTAATLENGCMYVIPRSAVEPKAIGSLVEEGPMEHGEVVQLLQAARALPAASGSLLGWDHELVHWSGIARHAAEPRISISVEFIAAGEDPRTDETPLLMEGGALPSFNERLQVIAAALQAYQRFEPLLLTRFEEFAERLTAAASSDERRSW